MCPRALVLFSVHFLRRHRVSREVSLRSHEQNQQIPGGILEGGNDRVWPVCVFTRYVTWESRFEYLEKLANPTSSLFFGVPDGI